MVVPQQISFGEVALLFICQEHSIFHSYRSTGVLFFCYCVSFSFFTLICVQIFLNLNIKVYFDLWSKLFQKGSNGVGKEKKFHAKKWYKKELM
jgi:hypothetical protein